MYTETKEENQSMGPITRNIFAYGLSEQRD